MYFVYTYIFPLIFDCIFVHLPIVQLLVCRHSLLMNGEGVHTSDKANLDRKANFL